VAAPLLFQDRVFVDIADLQVLWELTAQH
jgi:hypothetical protein